MKKFAENALNNKWFHENEASKLLNISLKTLKNHCRSGKLIYRVEPQNRKLVYYIHSDSIPENVKENSGSNIDENKEYANAPNWAKVQADKYIQIIKETKFLKGKELKYYISEWNKQNPYLKTSYSSVIRMKHRYELFGVGGLLAQYGKNLNKSIVKKKYFDYFKSLYLIEGAPSVLSCWYNTLGFAIKTSHISKDSFPSPASFIRKLKIEMPEQAIYLARYGETAYNRKYANYINRDYSSIECGKVWVSDHAQIDVAVFDSDGNVVFPWVTAWRDYKSGKWLGWVMLCGSPNSDRIFQAFYNAAKTYGLPDDVIIDNGKDYRSKDFGGGRKNDNGRTTSMLDQIGVQVHFALPYNAQTKPIERDFRTIKEYLSKHCEGYRGGNVVERPEILAKDLKLGKVMDFDKFKEIFNKFIIDVFNKKESEGKNLNGLSPDELFNQEFLEKRACSQDALKLFCMRTSNNYTIVRNGIQDRKLGITYWADWMVSRMKQKVYLRRDPENFKDAWVFKLENDEFLGKCSAVKAVAALHAGNVAKEEFQEAMSIKKRSMKLTRAYIDDLERIPFEEQCENYKVAFSKKIKKANPKITKIANTSMDKVIQKNKEMEAEGKYDLSLFIPEEKPEEELFLYETDRYVKQAMKGVANG